MIGKSIFLNDVPVEAMNDNKLWEPNSHVLHEIEAITNAILTESGQLTFAVHGAWGAGKTSFLRMIADTVESKSKGTEQEVKFCWYEASTYQGVDEPEITIALRIWNVLGGENATSERHTPEVLEKLRDYMRGVLEGKDIEPEDAEAKDRVKSYSMLQLIARKTGQLADFPRLLDEYLSKGVEGRPSKLVLVVDDLDRCRSEFIGEVLDVLQRLTSVDNLFVILGVDREVLLTAIRERYQGVLSIRDEHLALEKYIQYAIDLPEPTTDELTAYVQNCLPVNDGEEDGERAVMEIIHNNARYFVAGVRIKTPRTIKRSINAIRPALRMRLRQSSLSDEEQQLVIKEQLLAYNWRDFYRIYQQAKRDRNVEKFFVELERICQTLYAEEVEKEMRPEEQRDRRAIFDLQLERIKKRELSESIELDIKDELARLLAVPPCFFYGRQSDWLQTSQETTKTLAEQWMSSVGGQSNIDEEFLKLYLESEEADARGDARTSVEAAAKAYELVKQNRTRLDKSASPRLGNLGVNAEKYKVPDLAEAIFRLALEIDEYPGVLQQFASFILDNRPDLYAEAEAILKRLQTKQHANYKPWQTLRLFVQLKTQMGQPIEEDLIEKLVTAAEQEADARQLGILLDALIRANEHEVGFTLFAGSVQRLADKRSRYTLQRLVADAFARQPEAAGEFIAMDLYRQILGSPETMDEGDEPHVMHNYATLLYKHDYDDEAGCLWYTAYQNYPAARGNSGIRRAYSMYLLRTNRKDLAQKVIGGDSLDEMALIPTQKSLPERFSDKEIPNALGETDTAFACCGPLQQEEK